MALESVTYVNDLVVTNPTGGDPRSELDDHLRNVKTSLRNTFPEGSAPIYGLRSGTATATTSGTSVDFTSIPSWVKRITVSLVGVSTNGSSPMMIQIGDSGGIETAGYLGAVATLQDATALAALNFTTGIGTSVTTSAASAYHGVVTLNLVDSATNTWSASVNGGISNAAAAFVGGFSKSLSATLDRVRLTTLGGTATFDAGTVNIQYE